NLIADSAGYLQVADMAHLGSASLTLQNTANDVTPGTLAYARLTASSSKLITLGVGGGHIYPPTHGPHLTPSGVIGELLPSPGPGTLTLGNSTNNYAGGTFVNAGRLALGSGTAIPAGGNVTIAAGATFDTGGLGNTLATAVGTVALNGGTLRIPGALSSPFYINKLVTDA